MSDDKAKQDSGDEFEWPKWANLPTCGCVVWLLAVIAGWIKLKSKDW